MDSIWSYGLNSPELKEQTQDIRTDIVIIGGGITGILCGYMLKNAGVDCVVVEAEKICSGVTGNTTAKITCQHGLIYYKMIKRFGTETASLYLKAQKDALENYRKLSKIIPCDFEECESYVYSLKSREKIEREVKALEKSGVSPVFSENIPLPLEVKGAVGIKNQAQFHPLKFLYGIIKGMRIFENTKVIEIRSDAVITSRGKIQAKKVIAATHFPFLNKHGSYFLKMYQHRSYVVAYKNIPTVKGMYVDEDKKGMSFRNYKDIMLIGGGGHRTGKKGGGWKEISDFAETHYPEATEVCRFATQDCMTLDDIPYIGQYSKNTPSLYVASGFNKWGMTSAMAAASILTDLVLERKNPYAHVFSPSRNIIRPQLLVNAAEAGISLMTPTVPRCPHMGCALKYNPQEHSWDCSCHGSRFSENGEVINNPSNHNIK